MTSSIQGEMIMGSILPFGGSRGRDLAQSAARLARFNSTLNLIQTDPVISEEKRTSLLTGLTTNNFDQRFAELGRIRTTIFEETERRKEELDLARNKPGRRATILTTRASGETPAASLLRRV